jgi:hypothetical protein
VYIKDGGNCYGNYKNEIKYYPKEKPFCRAFKG